jgi:four helix bundle protein
MANAKIQSHRDLQVYRKSVDAGMTIFELSKRFPDDQKFSLASQIRRSSRSVSGNLAEAWRKRRYSAALASKLNDAEAEAAETQARLEYAVQCRHVGGDEAKDRDAKYGEMNRIIVGMINHRQSWGIEPKAPQDA